MKKPEKRKQASRYLGSVDPSIDISLGNLKKVLSIGDEIDLDYVNMSYNKYTGRLEFNLNYWYDDINYDVEIREYEAWRVKRRAELEKELENLLD